MLTPEEIQSREFLVSLRGYDRDEVHAFLDEVAEAFALLRAQAVEPAGTGEVQADTTPPAEVRAPATEVAPSPFAAIGAETQRILDAAQAAGDEMRARAKEDADRVRAEVISAAEAEVAELREQAAATQHEIDLLHLRRDEVSDRLRQARDTADLALMEIDIEDLAAEAAIDEAVVDEDVVAEDARAVDANAADASAERPAAEDAAAAADVEDAMVEEEQGLVAATLFAGEPAVTDAGDAPSQSRDDQGAEDDTK